MSSSIATFALLMTVWGTAPGANFIGQAFAEDTIEKGAPIKCEPDVQHETRNVAICGFNDASAPKPATYKCYNFYSYVDKKCERKCIFEWCED
ncbi:hypothetical protein [Mesorhizobium sp. M1365]|uniref:hypothetical protein n=1 Tax=Mesorhizobium sp. M1365 TaxID=2957090 RepID=UPI0033383173